VISANQNCLSQQASNIRPIAGEYGWL